MKYGYARISSNLQNFNIQVKELLEAGVDEENILKDVEKDNSKTLEGLVDGLREGDLLIVSTLDRLTREEKVFNVIKEKVEEKGASIINIR